MKHSITVSDLRGKSYPVLAARRIDSFRVLVVREWQSSGVTHAVHTFNEQDGGFRHGHYVEGIDRAMAVFVAALIGDNS